MNEFKKVESPVSGGSLTYTCQKCDLPYISGVEHKCNLETVADRNFHQINGVYKVLKNLLDRVERVEMVLGVNLPAFEDDEP